MGSTKQKYAVEPFLFEVVMKCDSVAGKKRVVSCLPVWAAYP